MSQWFGRKFQPNGQQGDSGGNVRNKNCISSFGTIEQHPMLPLGTALQIYCFKPDHIGYDYQSCPLFRRMIARYGKEMQRRSHRLSSTRTESAMSKHPTFKWETQS